MPRFIKPKEGDLILVPVNSKFIIGLITRLNDENIPLAYFYCNLFDSIPISMNDLNIDYRKPILILEIGSQGFKTGTWKIIGKLSNFNRKDFPVPVFLHHTKPFKPELVYFDDNMNEMMRKNIDESELEKYKNYPEIGLGGSGYIEKVLARLCL